MPVSRLTLAELADVTGRTQGAAQMRYFRRLGLHVFADGDGHPVVTWAALDTLLLGGRQQNQPEPELDLGAFRKAS